MKEIHPREKTHFIRMMVIYITLTIALLEVFLQNQDNFRFLNQTIPA